MADLTQIVKHFPTPSETYENNLSASISSGAVTVPVNANNEYLDGEIAVITVEPGTTNEATFTGEKASTPARFINCVWTEGNLGVGHPSGATVIDYDSATHVGMITKGIQVHANQDGTLKTTAVQAALNISSAVPSDYTSLAQTATTITLNGNRAETMLFPGVNYTDRLTPGMRLRTVRQTPAPTQCTSLNGTNQYWVKTAPNKMTFTDDFVVSAWVKLRNYPSSNAYVASRYNGTNGWLLEVNSSGQIALIGVNNTGANQSNLRTYQSVPLNKWVHIAAQLDMSAFTNTATTSYIMIDGIDVPAVVNRVGTNPTSLVQAGNLEIGSQNGGNQFFPGKIAQAAIFNAKVTQATMRGYISQGLSGTEPNLASAYSFNGVATDLSTATPNDLTASGGTTTDNADSPFGTQGNNSISATVDYAIIQKISYSSPDTIIEAQVPEGCTIPTTGGVASVSYSQFKTPYGMPISSDKWEIQTINKGNSTAIGGGWIYLDGKSIVIPVGKWKTTFSGNLSRNNSTASNALASLSTSTTSASDTRFTILTYSSLNQTNTVPFSITNSISLDAATSYYVVVDPQGIGGGGVGVKGDFQPTIITAENAYL